MRKKQPTARGKDEGPQLGLSAGTPPPARPVKGAGTLIQAAAHPYPPKEEFKSVEPIAASQMEFLGNFFPQNQEGYSHTVELFDAIPKFLFTSQRRRKTIEILVREFHHRGDEYRLALKPAAIETPEGPFLVFPGEREELVLRALRYMAVQQLAASSLWGHQQGHKQMRLAFTLSQLQNVLAEKVPGVDGKLRGHAFKLSEIDEALRVCRGATVSLEFTEAGKKAQHESGILSEYYAVDEETGDGQKSLRCVILHPLATAAILQQEYRSINYRRLMALPSPLGRWIYERLSHLFINAEKRRAWADGMRPPKGFTLDLETVLNESGVLRRKRFRENITEVRSALHELSMAGVLVPLPKGAVAGTSGPYVEKPVYGASQGGRRPVIGATWTLFPSDLLVQEIIEANIEKRDRLQQLPGGGNEPRKSGGWKDSAAKVAS